jgi:hypothetical protein
MSYLLTHPIFGEQEILFLKIAGNPAGLLLQYLGIQDYKVDV